MDAFLNRLLNRLLMAVVTKSVTIPKRIFLCVHGGGATDFFAFYENFFEVKKVVRLPDFENRNKRKKHISLSKIAYLVWKEFSKSKIFDFSAWISEKLIDDFYDKSKKTLLPKEELQLRIYQQKLAYLYKKKEEMELELNSEIVGVTYKIKTVREKIEAAEERENQRVESRRQKLIEEEARQEIGFVMGRD